MLAVTEFSLSNDSNSRCVFYKLPHEQLLNSYYFFTVLAFADFLPNFTSALATALRY